MSRSWHRRSLPVDPPVVELIHVLEGSELGIIEPSPWPVPINEFPFVEPVEQFDECVVVAVALRFDRGDNLVLSQPFGVGNTQIFCLGSTSRRNNGLFE